MPQEKENRINPMCMVRSDSGHFGEANTIHPFPKFLQETVLFHSITISKPVSAMSRSSAYGNQHSPVRAYPVNPQNSSSIFLASTYMRNAV